MATDIKKIISNLFEFYNFKDQTILSVGAGGGQFIEYGRSAGKVIAVDNDSQALESLSLRLKEFQLSEKFTLICSDFCSINLEADVVMFEFCLHEMTNPTVAIEHALTLAPNVLIVDHWIDSEWAFIVDEEEKVAKSWTGINRFDLRKVQSFNSSQYFNNYEELYSRVKSQGDNSINRIAKYRGKVDIIIPMSYGFALI